MTIPPHEHGMLERDADADLEFVRNETFSEHVVEQAILLHGTLNDILPGDGAVHVGRLAAVKAKSDIRYDGRAMHGIPAGKRRWLTEYGIRRTR